MNRLRAKDSWVSENAFNTIILDACFCVYISCVSCVPLFVTLCTVIHQAPLSMGFTRQEYWSGLPCPPPGDLVIPGI